MKKRVLSCIQPTGSMHLGNYFGAVKNWVKLQDEYDCIYGVVDLHSMTMPYNTEELKKNTLQMVIELLACGIDPEKSTLFIQSLVPQHTELNWILNCVTSYGELSRMTQFKDKSNQLEEGTNSGFVSAGLFNYPVLQAADILIYRAEYVPVGKDQEQHLELSRNIANRFNNQFGEFFPEPKPLFTEIPKLLSLADPTKKMSKSLGEKHYIGLFEAENSIRKKVNRAVTDSGDEVEGEISVGVNNLFTLLKASENFKDYDSLMDDYNNGRLQYGDLKGVVGDTLVKLTNEFKARKIELEKDPSAIDNILQKLSAQAREITNETIREVRVLTGLPQIKGE
jgi:tryptophanyl-tRNA synthetase